MKTLKDIKEMTGFDRRKIQQLEGIKGGDKLFEKENVSSGNRYHYSSDQVNLFMLAKFFSDCGYKTKDIISKAKHYTDDKNTVLEEAIRDMENQVKKLEENIKLAKNMQLTDLSIFDIDEDYDYSAAVINLTGLAINQYSDEDIENEFNNVDETLFEEFFNFFEHSQKEFKTPSFNLSEFKNNFEKHLNDLSNYSGVFSLSIHYWLFKDLLENSTKDFSDFIWGIINDYIKKMWEKSYEYKQLQDLQFIIDNSRNNSYKSKIIQDKIDETYKELKKIYCIDHEKEFKRILVRYKSNDFRKLFNEDENTKGYAWYIAQAFEYFIVNNFKEDE